jgi:hypothetical protein
MPGSGTAVINFGAFPGTSHASVGVAGQAGLVATSEIEAWVQPIVTASHSTDEHKIENLKVVAYYAADSALSIDGSVVPFYGLQNINFKTGDGGQAQTHKLQGLFTIGWAWA